MHSSISVRLFPHTPSVRRWGGFSLFSASLALALLMVALTTPDAQADGRAKSFKGGGSGTSEIINPNECSSTGECWVEFQGEFDAADIGMGTVRFQFADDLSGVSNLSASCSVPAAGVNNFIWQTTEDDVLVMKQTHGFICPSEATGRGYWKRILRIETGTGRFDGATGSLFISGSRTLETGEETWTFEGSITIPKDRPDGCYRAYFVGNFIVIPPKDEPPPTAHAIMFWLCGDDITLGGPNPREDYRIFNPNE